MRKNFGSKYLMYPMPVLVIGSYNENGSANAMTAAWGIICDYTKIMVVLDRNHLTTKNIIKKGAFTVSMATASTVKAADYIGIVSGAEEPNKVAKAGLTPIKSELIDAPLFAELPMTLECKLVSWEDETERLTGEIINVAAEESILTDGKIDPAKLQPITFDPVNMKYITLGEAVGNAFKDGLGLK